MSITYFTHLFTATKLKIVATLSYGLSVNERIIYYESSFTIFTTVDCTEKLYQNSYCW